MRIEFNQGVPDGAVDWLKEHVGTGNIITYSHDEDSVVISTYNNPQYGWFYERIEKEVKTYSLCPEVYYVPTITVKDERLAVLFALRWT